MSELLEYRNKIDQIDAEIVRLFEERMKISEAVAQYKIRTGMQVLDAEREARKIASVTEKATGDFNKRGTRELFTQIMAISRRKQYQMLTKNGLAFDLKNELSVVDELPLSYVKVVFQGVEGAYSYAAMRAYFDETIQSVHVKTWRDAMEDVVAGRADYAVLPIENSTAGIVGDIYDLLMQYRLYIVGEQFLKVDHVLLGVKEASLDTVRSVCSHYQGLAQCSEFLSRHPQWETIKMENTAQAAKTVAEAGDVSRAAIASRQAGEIYGLKILADNLCVNEDNATRFIIVGARPICTRTAGKVSICFELAHESGTLYNMLSHIIYNGLNMTKIESRPIKGRSWEYRFFVDFEGNIQDSAVVNALRGIGAEANKLRILGNY
ncbi:MAG: prephenate dehydratase [Blautia sp.]|nr:prephenate dehydratase [Blautia sp.]